MRLMLQDPLSEKDEKQQCGYFLLYVGQNGRDIFNAWTLTSAKTDKIDVLFEKHGAYCNPKQKVTVIGINSTREIRATARLLINT